MTEESPKDSAQQPSPKAARRALLVRIALCVGIALGIAALIYAWLFVTTPAAVRFPKLEHAHVRFQLVVDGTPVNFGEEAFQTHYAQACTDEISPDPIHFHDAKDQFMHLHWKGMTGGLVLKNYGWNMVGGSDDTLGYRFDAVWPQRVPTHGNNLPALPADAQLWVYTGDAQNPRERSMADFLYQDFETILGAKSSVSQVGWPDSLLFARASAHAGHAHDEPVQPSATSQEFAAPTHSATRNEAELTKIQNMLGNIVVFAQKDKPTGAQVTERFSMFDPLPESSCGG